MTTASLTLVEITGLTPGWYNVSAIYVITGKTPASQVLSLELGKRSNPAAAVDVVIAWTQKEFTVVNPEIDGTLTGVVEIKQGESIVLFGNVTSGTATVDKNLTYVNYTQFAGISTGTSSDIKPITLDAMQKRVGINQSTPTKTLDVDGDARITGRLDVGGLAPFAFSADKRFLAIGETPEDGVHLKVGSFKADNFMANLWQFDASTFYSTGTGDAEGTPAGKGSMFLRTDGNGPNELVYYKTVDNVGGDIGKGWVPLQIVPKGPMVAIYDVGGDRPVPPSVDALLMLETTPVSMTAGMPFSAVNDAGGYTVFKNTDTSDRIFFISYTFGYRPNATGIRETAIKLGDQAGNSPRNSWVATHIMNATARGEAWCSGSSIVKLGPGGTFTVNVFQSNDKNETISITPTGFLSVKTQ